MSALSVLSTAVKNFQPTASVAAGGAASILTFAAGCVLVAAGLSVPVMNIPITMTMVGAAAPIIGHLVTSLVPDTYNQQIKALATKLQTSVENIKEVIPQASPGTPSEDQKGQPTV